LISSQSNYPLKTVIKGDSVVILTVKQADDINAIFESQKAKIAAFKKDIITRDSIISLRDTLLVYYTSKYTEYRTIIETQIIREDKLDTIRGWLIDRAKEGSWLYYSYINKEVVAVDFSDYVVRKDDYTGDIMFYKRTEDCSDDKEQKEPPVGWHTDIVKPKRPKLNIFKL
jgi:hypothetical protein